MKLVILIFIALSLTGCVSLPHHFKLASVDSNIVFPGPPDMARLSYTGTIVGESNIVRNDKTKTVAQKWLRILVGLPRFNQNKEDLLRPIAITTWSGEDVFVVDAGNSSVLKINELDAKVASFNNAGKRHSFNSPVSISKLASEEIIIADSALGEVSVLDREGNWQRSFGANILEMPVGLAVDPRQNNIYVADSKADNIKVFDVEGELIDIIGGSGEGPGQFNGPTHLALKYPWLAVSDTLNGRVQLINLMTEEIKVIGSRGLNIGNFVRPKGLGFDSDFNLYVLEGYHDYLLIYNLEGQFLLAIGGSGQEHGQFNLPSGLYIDERDSIYITDMLNGRVEVFQYLGS